MRPEDDILYYLLKGISIHAPLAGCDPHAPGDLQRQEDFNPRTPCGVRRSSHAASRFTSLISIHAPLAGCDPSRPQWATDRPDFNPRTPCGVRRRSVLLMRRFRPFQSTHPLRGATINNYSQNISFAFQSTHPLRGATFVDAGPYMSIQISIHAPLAGCDAQGLLGAQAGFYISIHAPLAGCDTVT